MVICCVLCDNLTVKPESSNLSTSRLAHLICFCVCQISISNLTSTDQVKNTTMLYTYTLIVTLSLWNFVSKITFEET